MGKWVLSTDMSHFKVFYGYTVLIMVENSESVGYESLEQSLWKKNIMKTYYKCLLVEDSISNETTE